MGSCIDTICCLNIDPYARQPIEDLLGKTLQLSLRLGKWRREMPPTSLVAPGVDLGAWTPDDWETHRNAMLLTIFYYRTVLLVHGILVMTTLEESTRRRGAGSPAGVSDVLRRSAAALFHDDLDAADAFRHLICGILTHNPAFLKLNSVWWTCNYAALTISLHTFAFWLASNCPDTAFMACGNTSAQLEARLGACLDTLRAIGAPSAMSVKAHRCLQRHLDFLKTRCTSTLPHSVLLVANCVM